MMELNSILEGKKNVEGSIQEKSEFLYTMEQANTCLQNYSTLMNEALIYTKSVLNEDYFRQTIVRKNNLVDLFEQKCLEHEAEFEKSHFAQGRKTSRQELQKVIFKDKDKNYKIYKGIQEKRERKAIISLAEVWLNYRNCLEEFEKAKEQADEWTSEIDEQEQEIQAFLKELEDKEAMSDSFNDNDLPSLSDFKEVCNISENATLMETEVEQVQ